MVRLTSVQVCVAAACVIGASTAVRAQSPVAGAAAPAAAAAAAAHGAVAGDAAPASGLEATIESADADDMVTDRPDFTESSEVVPRGGYQFESGLSYEGDVRGGVRGRSLTAPGALMRIGLGARTELRLGGDGFLSESVGGVRASGYSDFEVGLKIRLLDQAKAGVDVAVIPMASLPTGADGFTAGHVDPTLKLTWARSLPAGFDMTGNVNFASVSDEAGRFTQKAVSVSFGHDLLAGWGGFAELYSFTPMERGQKTGLTLDAGVSRPVGRNLQFDVEAGRGLTAAAPDWFIGFGFAIRGRTADWR